MFRKIFFGMFGTALCILGAAIHNGMDARSKPRLTVSPAAYQGPCPTSLVFEAEVDRPAPPGRLKYRFVRSDGVIGPVEEAVFKGSKTAKLTYVWRLGRDFEGWVLLKIISPWTVESEKARFIVQCAAGRNPVSEEPPLPGESAPRKIYLDFRAAVLEYDPSLNFLYLRAGDAVLSRTDEWEISPVKPFLFHIRHRDWTGFYWQVNTVRSEVIEIAGGSFGNIASGNRRQTGIALDGPNPEEGAAGEGFVLNIPGVTLVYAPDDALFRIQAGAAVLSRGEGWEFCQVHSRLFHFRFMTWPDFFWRVSATRQAASVVTNGVFCRPGGSASDLNAEVRVVD